MFAYLTLIHIQESQGDFTGALKTLRIAKDLKATHPVFGSLARLLDRPLAKQIFYNDAEAAIAALRSLAIERGLAQAHACVLELGVEATSGAWMKQSWWGAICT